MKMNRREFLYSIACGTTAIAGWVLIPGCAYPSTSRRQTNIQFRPALEKHIAFRRTPEGGEVMRPDNHGVARVVCRVNEHGWTIIENLNGRNTLQGLAEKFPMDLNPDHLERTKASVASFLALLAQAGLLSEPFFVNLQASEVTA